VEKRKKRRGREAKSLKNCPGSQPRMTQHFNRLTKNQSSPQTEAKKRKERGGGRRWGLGSTFGSSYTGIKKERKKGRGKWSRERSPWGGWQVCPVFSARFTYPRTRRDNGKEKKRGGGGGGHSERGLCQGPNTSPSSADPRRFEIGREEEKEKGRGEGGRAECYFFCDHDDVRLLHLPLGGGKGKERSAEAASVHRDSALVG